MRIAVTSRAGSKFQLGSGFAATPVSGMRRPVSAMRMPEAGVIRQALNLYQAELRKPSLTAL
ncbi:hypothetical protein ACC728_40105, partial [Rhizobium ruizarguesonis]